MQTMKREPDLKREELNLPQASFQAFLEQGELFSEIIEFFPYPIEVFARDGTTVMVNCAMLAEYKIWDKDMIIGKYNIFRDPEVEKSGLMDLVREVFQGRSITVTDVRVPVKSIKEYYKVKYPDINSMYQDITGFPIRDEQGELSHVVLLFITRRVYKVKVSIIKVIEYLENNWDKPYDINEAAKAANLSPSHLSRVFKSEMGIT
jgi:AraC family transcriptional regulator